MPPIVPHQFRVRFSSAEFFLKLNIICVPVEDYVSLSNALKSACSSIYIGQVCCVSRLLLPEMATLCYPQSARQGSSAFAFPLRIQSITNSFAKRSRSFLELPRKCSRISQSRKTVNVCAENLRAKDIGRHLTQNGKLYQSDERLFSALTDARANRLQRVVESRTRHVAFCFDEVHGVHNLAAVVRSCDAWGIQDLHIVLDENQAGRKHSSVGEKRCSDTSLSCIKSSSHISELFESTSAKKVSKGAHKWLSIHEYASSRDAVMSLKRNGYRLCVSSLDPSARKLAEVNILSEDPVCFVFGNESSGVSQELFDAADELFTIPMFG